MDWETLLSEKRLREILQGDKGASHKTAREFRGEFERDYGRAIFSTPVRRLLDKAQVFPLDPHDAIRTRLTHSHEVAAVARNLSRSIALRLLDEKKLSGREAATAIEEIATTCAIIHDLGNPPFGHAGERAIQDWFRKSNRFPKDAEGSALVRDFTDFDGNAQTIRLISRLQFISDPHGLNLTCGTLSAALKYIADASTVDKNFHPRRKIGVFASEIPLRDAVQKATGTGAKRNPITYIVESCDDIVYATVDIEDAVKKRALEWSLVEDVARNSACSMLKESLKKARDYVERDPNLTGPEHDEAMAQMFRTFVIGSAVPAVKDSFFEHYETIMAGELTEELISVSGASEAISLLKEIGRKHIYTAPEVLRLEIMGRNVIHGLLQIFNEGAMEAPEPQPGSYPDKVYRLISTNYRRAYEHAIANEPLPQWYFRFRLLVDYVSGMTDSFACNVHSRLLNG
jgi:dGTPase